ncbi:MAG: lantibiotic dehydratase [Myxococcota bacterium]
MSASPLSFERRYRPSGFFGLRSPLLPWETLSSGLSREALRAVVEQPEVQRAIALASPSVAEALPTWQAEGAIEPSRLELSLFQYVSRAAGRATPFGLLAGCSVGTLGPRTALHLAPRSAYRARARISSPQLWAALGDPAIRPKLRFCCAPSLHHAFGRLRYAPLELAEIEASAPLEALLEEAQRPVSAADLEALLERRFQMAPPAAQALVSAMIAHQLLIPEQAPAAIGPGFPGDASEPLQKLEQALRDTADRPIGPHSFVEAEALLAGLEPRRPLQVELVKPLQQGTLGPAPIQELLRTADLLWRLFPPERYPLLERFQQAFVARYDRAEVPLAEALDPELGIPLEGVAAEPAVPILEGVALPATAPIEPLAFGAKDALVWSKLQVALRSGADHIQLGPEDLPPAVTAEPPRLPPAFVALTSLRSTALDAVDRGEFELIEPRFTTPATSLLARFAHADPELLLHLRAHVRCEEEQAQAMGAVLADVTLPDPEGAGDVHRRPSLYQHQILLGPGARDAAATGIALEDLWVSVSGGEIILRSKRLQRRVLPRIASAQDASQHPSSYYRFLYELQNQEGVLRSWSWGAFQDTEALPRVRAGKTLLAAARWNLGPARLGPLHRASPAERPAKMAELRAALGVPRWIAIVEGDQALPLDTESSLGLAALVRRTQGKAIVRIKEIDPGAGLLLRGPEGSFLHELVIPFLATSAPPPAPTPPPPLPVSLGLRSKAPGGDLLSAKIFAGRSDLDGILLEVIAPLMRAAERSGLSRRWFFVRADDGGPQLRVRVAGDRRLWSELLPALHDALLPSLSMGRIQRLEIDTYQREVERYGGPRGMDLAEEIFHRDSALAVEQLRQLRASEEGPEDRVLALARSWDHTLRGLGFSDAEKISLCVQAERSLGRELEASGLAPYALAEPARRLKERLIPLLASPPGPEEEARRLGLEALRSAAEEGALSAGLPDLAFSLLHMSANRLLRSGARIQELLLHDALTRAYRAQVARRSHRSHPC